MLKGVMFVMLLFWTGVLCQCHCVQEGYCVTDNVTVTVTPARGTVQQPAGPECARDRYNLCPRAFGGRHNKSVTEGESAPVMLQRQRIK